MAVDADPGGSPAQRANWGWIVGCGFAGAALIGLALLMEATHSWQGVSESAFVEAGTALLFGAILFLIEPRFVRRVGKAATEAASAAAEARVDERTRELSARLDQLDQLMSEELRGVHEVQDEAVRDLAVPTFESVAGALATANKIGALKNGHVTVQASESIEELGLIFSWGMELGDGRFGREGKLSLSIEAIVYADRLVSGGRPYIAVDWQSGTSPDNDEPAMAVGLELIEALRKTGRWNGDGTLKWQFALENLQDALKWAIASRRKAGDGPLLHGALAEFINEEWAITDAGLECPVHQFILPGDEFPERRPFPGRPSPEFRPTRPDWVYEGLWKLMIERARRLLPIQRGPASFTPSWIPWDTSPQEMRASAVE